MQPHKADDLSPTFGRSHRADHGSRSDRNIQAVFSWTVSLCVRRSAVGSSLALSATGSRARAVRATASCPDTRMAIMSNAFGGTDGTSSIDVRLPNCAYDPGAGCPRERMRSAIRSTDVQSSVYCVMNIAWRSEEHTSELQSLMR